MSTNPLGVKRPNKRSALANSTNKAHAPQKRNKLETLNHDVEAYSNNLLEKCGNATGINCLLDNFGSRDMNLLYSIVQISIK